MGILSSDYHIPRIKALSNLLFQKKGIKKLNISLFSAEEVLKKLKPGIFDQEINQAYLHSQAKIRLKNEQKGCNDIKSGKYVLSEFQLK